MTRLIILAFTITILKSSAQSISTLLGAKSTGMGNASATLQGEWAMFNNIAGLAGLEDTQTGASFDVRPSLTSANRMGALMVTPFSFGVIGASIFRFGDGLYSEQLISLGFANQIGNTSLGGRVSYIQYRAEGFGTKGTIGIDFGGITKLTQRLYIGAWVQNLNQPKLRFDNEEKAPIKLYVALAYNPSDKFFISTELEKDVFYNMIWKTGLEYVIHKKFFARTGINVNPNSVFAGVGFQSWRIKIDYAFQGFTQFSASHQASASYRITSSKKSEK